MADDLSAPLGQDKKRKTFKLPPGVPVAIAGALGLCLAVFVLWAMFADDPFGGEPVVVVAAPDAHTPVSKPEPAADASAKPAAAAEPAAEPPATPPGTQTVTVIDGTSGKAQDVVVPASGGAPAPTFDPKLMETTRHGQIPRVGADGARAFVAYARPDGVPAAKANLPRIALVIGGLGISGSSTAEALAKLPGPVTMAFAPYGSDVGRLAARARGEGHETLLQLPMEPFDFPDNDPGPQTLLTSMSAEQNVDRMHWLMSRFQGYVGVANYMGGRFTATEASLAPVLRETAKRGLMFLDDGTSPRSLAGQIAGANNLPFAKAGVVLDLVPTAAEIDRALLRLEAMARESGAAVGTASALPVTIERLARWAKTAESRGFLLVPISVVASKTKSNT